MTVTLYSTTDDRRVLNKTITSVISIQTASIYGDITLTHPSLLLEYNSSIYQCNYAYIPEFSRYYFINNITFSSGNRMILTLEVDVLMTYKSSILGLDITVVRNQYAKDNFLPDKFMTPTSKKEIKTYKLQNSNFNITDVQSGHNFVLCIVGGAGSPNN